MSWRWMAVMLVVALGAGAQAPVGYPGRFAPLRNVGGPGEAEAVNETFALLIEKVFKVHALVPGRRGEAWGQRVYAGSFALAAPDGRWGFALPETARRTAVAWPEPQAARVTQTLSDGGWRAAMQADVASGYPAIWLTLRREAGDAPLQAALLGYGWAERTAPTWTAGGRPVAANTPLAVDATGGVTLVGRDAGFTSVLHFNTCPEAFEPTGDGLSWRYPGNVANARVLYLVLPGQPADGDLATLVNGLAAPPRGLTQRFGARGDTPWVEVSTAAPGMLALPPTLADAAADGVAIDTAQGPIRLVPGRQRRFELREPDALGVGAPLARRLKPAAQAHVESLAREFVARQSPDGTWPFNRGRGFWDSMTVACLAEVLGVLPPADGEAAGATVMRGVHHLWADQQPCPLWPGVMLPPEQEGFLKSAIDYPEILGCVLQATALAAEQCDATYAPTHWPELARQMAQLRGFMDPNGIALANPGPAFHHVIAESALGGYVAWQGLYELASLAGQPAAAAEAEARAAYAWRAWRTLFRWRPEFGEPAGVVNGIERGRVELLTQPAWAYVQTTYFGVYPSVVLPADDHVGVWRCLARQPWWEWTGALGSTQRMYDGANAIALARAGHREEVDRHWATLAQRPFRWTSFDESPALELAAWWWLGGVDEP